MQLLQITLTVKSQFWLFSNKYNITIHSLHFALCKGNRFDSFLSNLFSKINTTCVKLWPCTLWYIVNNKYLFHIFLKPLLALCDKFRLYDWLSIIDKMWCIILWLLFHVPKNSMFCSTGFDISVGMWSHTVGHVCTILFIHVMLSNDKIL